MYYTISYDKRYCHKNHPHIIEFNKIISNHKYDFSLCYSEICLKIPDVNNVLDLYLSWCIINYTPDRINYLLNEFTYVKILPIHLIAIAIDIDELKAYVYLVTNILQIKPHHSIKYLQSICNIDSISYCTRMNNYINYTFIELIIYNYKSVIKHKKSILPNSILHYLAYEFDTQYSIYHFKQFNQHLVYNFDYEIFDSCKKINKFNKIFYSYALLEALEYSKWGYIFSLMLSGIDFWESFNQCSLKYIVNVGVIYDINPKFIGNKTNIKWIIKNSYNEDKLQNSEFKQIIIRFQRLCMLYGFDDIAILVNKVYNLSILSLIDCAITFKRHSTLKELLIPKNILQIDINHWLYYISLCKDINNDDIPSYYKVPFSSSIQILKLLLNKSKYLINILLKKPIMKLSNNYNYENIYGNYTASKLILNIIDNSIYNTYYSYYLLDFIICLKQGHTILRKLRPYLYEYINNKTINVLLMKCVQYSDYPTFMYLLELYTSFSKIILFNNSYIHKNIENIEELLEISFVNSDKRILEYLCNYITKNKIKTNGFRLHKCFQFVEMYNYKLPFKYMMKRVDIIRSYSLISPETKWNIIFDYMSYLNVDEYLLYKFIKTYNVVCQSGVYFHFISNVLSNELLNDLYKCGYFRCSLYQIISQNISSHKILLSDLNKSSINELIINISNYSNLEHYINSLNIESKLNFIYIIINENLDYILNFNKNIKYVKDNYSLIEQTIIFRTILKEKYTNHIIQFALIKYNFYKCYDYLKAGGLITKIVNIYNRVHVFRMCFRKKVYNRFINHHKKLYLTVESIKCSPPTNILKGGGQYYRECKQKHDDVFSN